MKRAIGLASSFMLPLIVGFAVLAVMMGGGNEDAEGWMRAASFTVLPAAFANLVAAWIVAFRPGAPRPGGQFQVFLRALATFALAVPLVGVFATIALSLSGENSMSILAVGGVVALFAAIMGVLPMTLLQWLAYHFTLDRNTA